MIKVLYFARLREELNTTSESIEAVPDLRSLKTLHGARWRVGRIIQRQSIGNDVGQSGDGGPGYTAR